MNASMHQHDRVKSNKGIRQLKIEIIGKLQRGIFSTTTTKKKKKKNQGKLVITIIFQSSRGKTQKSTNQKQNSNLNFHISN